MRAILLLAVTSGCYIVEPGGGSGGDDSPPPPPGDASDDAGPVGRSFFFVRSPSTPSCAFFAEENQSHEVMVFSVSNVQVDGVSADQVNVRTAPAIESQFDAPNLEFRIFESWTSAEGSAAPDIGYRVWISGSTQTGEAFTTFGFNGTVCDYRWTII